jgi:hypothetical protein
MKQSALLVSLVAVLGLCVPAGAADIRVEKEAVVDPQQLARLVEVADVQTQDGGDVTGTVVNRSANPVREVKLAIQYVWLWKNEMHPGQDDPGHTDFYVLADEIPPGGRVRFTYRPRELLPRRSDGHFEVEARALSLVQIQPAGPVTNP